ncbi:MAG TPA: PQQ-binding-like beta-propeller repeat protein [Thermoanaerobaculia bacterium]
MDIKSTDTTDLDPVFLMGLDHPVAGGACQLQGTRWERRNRQEEQVPAGEDTWYSEKEDSLKYAAEEVPCKSRTGGAFRWSTPIPGEGVSSAVIARGRVFVTTAIESPAGKLTVRG